MNRRLFLSALTLSLASAGTLIAAEPTKAEPPQEYRTPVTAIRAQRAAIRQLTHVQGVVEAIDAPEIKSKVAAEVVEVLVDEGDRVESGQVLARLDDEAFRLDRQAAESDINRLQALLENQLRTLKRDESLFVKKLISDARLDNSRSAVKQTRAQLAHARTLLDKARYQLSHTRILAPVAGVIQFRSVSRGDYVNPNSPSSRTLFQIVDNRNLRARLYFPESLVRSVHIGMPVTLIKGPERIATRINRLRPMLQSDNRSLHALADFKNRGQWRPGESISADAVLAERQQAVVVPETVLVRRPAGLVVYRLENGTAHEQRVETGIRQDGRVEILSGVREGDLLALDGAAYLSDAVRVDIKGDVK